MMNDSSFEEINQLPQSSSNRRWIVFVSLILAAAVTRLLPHPFNFSPIGGMALFAGAKIENKRLALLLPILSMLAADFVIGFHSGIPFVYGSFLLVVCLGMFLKSSHRLSPFFIASGAITGSILFFLITNFGVWVTQNMYSKNFSGLVTSYTTALPFFQGTLVGDLCTTFALFGLAMAFEKRFFSQPFLKV